MFGPGILIMRNILITHDGIFKSVVLEEYKTKIGRFAYEQFRLV